MMSKVQQTLKQNILICGLLSLLLTESALAEKSGVSLSRTRVIFSAAEEAQSLEVKNQSDKPYLIKSTVTTTMEGKVLAPFIVTPPLFRLEANSEHQVRILHQDIYSLPTDRESVFYLSVMMVPSSPRPEEGGTMAARVSVGVQNIIKLFYRPAGLAIEPERAQAGLNFLRQGKEVSVKNPSPYYITLARMAFNDQVVNLYGKPTMIAPFSEVSYSVTGSVSQAEWTVIDDFGGQSPRYQATIKAEK